MINGSEIVLLIKTRTLMAANISGFTVMDLAHSIHKFNIYILIIKIKVTKCGNHLPNTGQIHHFYITDSVSLTNLGHDPLRTKPPTDITP